MLRVIFDTNIYGLLLKEADWADIERKITADKEFVVYSYQPIRKEIRDIPKVTKLSKKTRVALLCLYDNITHNHFFENSIQITNLAKKYHDCYKNFGGIYRWDTNIRIDFMIVACASIHGLDIVYSEDRRTLGGKAALKAYKHINLKESLRTPNLYSYSDLILRYRNSL